MYWQIESKKKEERIKEEGDRQAIPPLAIQ